MSKKRPCLQSAQSFSVLLSLQCEHAQWWSTVTADVPTGSAPEWEAKALHEKRWTYIHVAISLTLNCRCHEKLLGLMNAFTSTILCSIRHYNTNIHILIKGKIYQPLLWCTIFVHFYTFQHKHMSNSSVKPFDFIDFSNNFKLNSYLTIMVFFASLGNIA